MKKSAILVVFLFLGLALPAFAAEDAAPSKPTGPSVETKKAQTLKVLDDQIARLQEAKACVQAAKDHDELRACREKLGPVRGPGGHGRPGRLGGMGRPAGPEGAGGPVGPGGKAAPQGQ